MEKKEKTKKFRLFDFNRDGKGVDPGEDTTPNLKFFFKQLWRKLSKIISLNLIMDVQVLPILLAVYLYFFGGPTTPSVSYPEFPVLYGMQQISSTAASSMGLNNYSIQLGLPTYNTYVYWVIGALAVFMLVTYGWQKVGSIYVTRGLVRGDSVFIMSDYFYAIKRNLKQGFFLGIIDCLIMFVLIYDFMYFYSSAPNAFTNFMYVMTIALIIIYVIIRFYLYLQIVTFDIKISKAFKNALIFTVLGVKRNLMACLGLVILTLFAVGMMVLFLPMGGGVTIVLPLIYYLGISAFIYTYAAYPIIKKHMIDPPVTPSDPEEETAEA